MDKTAYKEQIATMKSTLEEWKTKTGDDFPNPLTQNRYDFFTAKSNAANRHFLDIDRGSIAGQSKDAVKIKGNSLGFRN